MKLLIGLIFAILSVVSGQSSSTPSDQTSYKSISVKFVALRETSNREHLCWAIKIAPTAFVTAADCLKGYNKTQLFMTFGDIQPEAAEQKRLKNKLNVLMKNCRHQIENVALLVENKQSVLFKTVQNYLASYSLLGPVEKCSECSILKIQRRFNCPVKNVAVVFNNCTNHVESNKTVQKSPIMTKHQFDKLKEQLKQGLQRHFEESRYQRQIKQRLFRN